MARWVKVQCNNGIIVTVPYQGYLSFYEPQGYKMIDEVVKQPAGPADDVEGEPAQAIIKAEDKQQQEGATPPKQQRGRPQKRS